MAPRPTRFDPLPPQPEAVPWPIQQWPESPPAADVDAARLSDLFASAFGSTSYAEQSATPDPATELMLASVVIHRGHLVAESYGPTASPDETLISWSMAKSVTHALVGLLTLDGLIDIDAPAPVAEWANDERAAITTRQLLAMTSGLSFNEDYVDDRVSDVIEMLFGAGQADAAGYAIDQPLAAEPGTTFSYSSGTTNIVAKICGDLLGGEDAVRSYLDTRLFEPLGMTSADPRFDDAGTFIGSSFLYCTARDFARFGNLYLRDGLCDGQRLLPEGWVDLARRPVEVEVDEDFFYGSHWWLWDDTNGAFACHGYEGQYIVVVPARDLIVVRLGKTPAERKVGVIQWIHDIIACFPESLPS